MENKVSKEKCCGCGACRDICPVGCITMEYDKEGFKYPYIDYEKCTHCGLCNRVCPVDKTLKSDYQPKFYAGYTDDDEIITQSSSGGVFWPIVLCFLKENSIIYGAVLDSNLIVSHKRCETVEECLKLRKSKYLQSDLSCIYKNVKSDLNKGKKVLFSGTPCQIAALYSFLGGCPDNLYTVDVVCHGVPSQFIFKRYIEELEMRNHKKVISYCWRDKRYGWGPNRVTVVYEDGYEETEISKKNPMQRGFLDNWYLRPSCYQCEFARIPRVADISLADFWGYDIDIISNNNKGISLITVSSSKGKEIFDVIKDYICFHEVSEEYACSKSRHLWTHPKVNKKRKKFMNDFLQGKSFSYLHYSSPLFLSEDVCMKKTLTMPRNSALLKATFIN